MRSLSKYFLALLLGLAGLVAAATPASASPPPPQHLGSLDLGAYCRSLGHAGATLTGATAYDWKCAGSDRGLSFAEACKQAHNSGYVVDRIDDFYNPTSVSCWSVQPDVVTPDFAAYCTGQGYSGSALLGPTVYDWHCVRYSRAGPTYHDIDVPAACRELTHGYARLDRFDNFHDASSWQCRV